MSLILGDRNVPTPCTSFALLSLFLLLPLFTAHAAPTLTNPSFETNTFNTSPGYIINNSAITGWVGTPTNRVGLNIAGGQNVMADNGVVPQGTRVAFIESTGGVRSTLSTTIKGLTTGTTYLVSFRTNARAGSGTPRPSYRINGESPVPFGVGPVNTAATFTAAYHTMKMVFKATATTAALEISNTTSTDSTLLVDDFQIMAAVPLVVMSNADTGPGSLRAVLDTADGTPEFNVITFDASLAGQTITLTDECFVLDSVGVVIDASAIGGITIDGGPNTNRVVRNWLTSALFLRRLTLTGGMQSGGGAIENYGWLGMDECTLTGNNSTQHGGAVNNSGSLVAARCTFSSNQATSAGGGIRSNTDLGGDFVSLVQCTFLGNSAGFGGALYNVDGRMILSHCTLSGNSAPFGMGAGVSSDANIAFTETVVSNCIIQANQNNADVDRDGVEVNSSYVSLGGNVIGNGEETASFGATGDVVQVDALLLSLANNGGPTQTMAFAAASPARGAAVGSRITEDQRGLPVAGVPDSGAYEMQSGTFQLSAATADGSEGGVAQVIIQRSADVAGPVTLRLLTTPGTATAADFTARPNTAASNVLFLDGETSKTVFIPLTADALTEGDHVFTVTLTAPAPTPATVLGAQLTATVTITDALIVTNTNDAGLGSLRQVLAAAASKAGPDAIGFAPALNGKTIELGSGLFIVDQPGVTIDASGLPKGITIDGGPGAFSLMDIGGSTTVVTLRCLTLTSGFSTSEGGAILNRTGSYLTLDRCTLSGNESANTGGAVSNQSGATVVMTQCTLSGNAAQATGGAFFNQGTATLAHCTLKDNAAATGSGIFNDGNMTLARSLVRDGSGGGKDVHTTTNMDLVGTTFAGTTDGPFVGSGAINNSDPLLGPLADNGGPTKTHALLAGSAAVDLGVANFKFDQRGVSLVDGSRDSGAYEAQGGGTFVIATRDAKGSEGAQATVTIQRLGGFIGPASVRLSTKPGTAGAADFIAVNQVVNFTSGDDSEDVLIDLATDSTTEKNETFTVTLSEPSAGSSIGFPGTETVVIEDIGGIGADPTVLPTFKLTSPAEGAAVGVDVNGQILLQGTAQDNQGVDRMRVSLNGVDLGVNTTAMDQRGATATTFSHPITPATGLNTVQVRVIDSRGNSSDQITRKFRVLRPLRVNVSGDGAVTPTSFTPKSYREVGKPYAITAVPGKGQMFAGWSILSAHSVSQIGASALHLPVLNFIHREGLALRASFVESPYTPDVVGLYEGGIYLNGPSGPKVDTEGYFSLTLQSLGSFTGKLLLDGGTVPISGGFDSDGDSIFGVNRTGVVTLLRKDKPALTLSLGFGVSGEIIGTISLQDDSGRTLGISAKRCPYSVANPVPSGLLGTGNTDGHYTTAFLRDDNSVLGYTDDQYPQGDGTGYWKLSKTGAITVTATLADGTAFTAKAALADDNTWRLYAPLYSGKGLIVGNMAPNVLLTEDYRAEDSLWIRPTLDTQHYPGGWTDPILVDTISAKYTVTPGLSVVPNSGSITVRFTEGLLSATQDRTCTTSAADIVTNTSGDTGFTMKIDRATGLYSGTFTHSDTSKTSFKGVILNKDFTSFCRGFFLSTAPSVKDYTGQVGKVELLR